MEGKNSIVPYNQLQKLFVADDFNLSYIINKFELFYKSSPIFRGKYPHRIYI